MKTVIYGNFGTEDKEGWVADALEKKTEVVRIEKKHYNKSIVMWGSFDNVRHEDPENWIFDTFVKKGHNVVRIQKTMNTPYKDEILKACKDNNADILLFIKPEIIPLDEYIAICKECQATTVMWNFDWMMAPGNKEWFVSKAKVTDIVFGTDGYKENDFYIKEGINRIELHQGIDKDKHSSIDVSIPEYEKYACDVAFIGSLYTKEREKLDKFLRDNYNYRLYGNTKENRIWYREFSKLCRVAKIIIGDNYVNDIDGYWSDRVYLTLGSGGFLLTHYVNGLEKEFQDGVHLAWWKDYKELKDKIEYYLSRPEERKKIAHTGYLEVQENHNYDKRIERFLSVVENYRINNAGGRFRDISPGSCPGKSGSNPGPAIPILLLCYNRCAYTMLAYEAIKRNSDLPYKLFIWDNNSTDETRTWLKYIQKIDKDVEIYLSPENVGISKSMNAFIKKFKDYPIIAKVDNDTIVPENWLSILKDCLENNNLCAVSPMCLRPSGDKTMDWFNNMKQEKYKDYTVYLNSYLSGTGLLIKTRVFHERGLLFEKFCELGTWTWFQRKHSDEGGRYGWCGKIWNTLLNIKGDRELSNDYPEYDKKIQEVRDNGNKIWESIGGLEGMNKLAEKEGVEKL